MVFLSSLVYYSYLPTGVLQQSGLGYWRWTVFVLEMKPSVALRFIYCLLTTEPWKQRHHYKKKRKKTSQELFNTFRRFLQRKTFSTCSFLWKKRKKATKPCKKQTRKQHTGTQEEETVLCQKSGLTDHSSGVFFSRIMLRAIVQGLVQLFIFNMIQYSGH